MNKQKKKGFTSDTLKETAVMTIAVGIIAVSYTHLNQGGIKMELNKAIGTPIERTTEQITPAIARPDIVFNSCLLYTSLLWIASDATSFPGSQTAGFSSFRPQSRLAAPHGFSLSVLS